VELASPGTPRRDLGTRDTTWQILRKPAVGESPFLRARYQQCTQCGTLMIMAF